MALLVKIALALLGLLCVAEGGVVKRQRRQMIDWTLSKCPEVKTVDVELKELVGKWYLQMYNGEGGFLVNCANDNFTITPDGLSAVVNSTYITKKDGKYGDILTNWDQLQKGEFIYHLQKFPIFLVRVLVTAYEKDVGVVIDTCMLEDEGNGHWQVLTRDPQPDPKVVEQLVEFSRSAGVKIGHFDKVSHENCPK